MSGTETMHTPGPWLIITTKRASKSGRVHLSNTRALQWSSPVHYVGRVTEHNAALIRVAPELLEALNEIHRIVSTGFNPTEREMRVLELAARAVEATTGHEPVSMSADMQRTNRRE